jgi:Beta-1,4-xylanase
MTQRNWTLFIILFAFIATSCSISNTTNAQKPTSLKDAFKDDFLIGTAMSDFQAAGRDEKALELIKQHFNSITPENLMKAERLMTGWKQYDFSLADKMVAFAQENNIKINGHTFIWHSQMPAFMRGIRNPDSVRAYFEDIIQTVGSRYDGKVDSWDVVNEALNEDGTLRQSTFLRALGEDYIVEAFRLAQKATPNSKLYYNDYNIEQPKKRAGAIAIIKKIQEAGVRIDGVGIQGHWHLGKVPFKDIEESIKEFSALGIKVMFTELDISVLPSPWDNTSAEVSLHAAENPKMNPYVNGLPDSVSQQLAKDYEELFKLFLKYKDHISRITFWGVNDGQSWLNGWPIRGRTNYPLLFDRQYQPKAAYYSIMALKTGK